MSRDTPKVTIYTTPTCQYCDAAKKFFNRHGVEYEEYDVSKDVQARKEMEEKSHQRGVPVIEIGKHIFVGFNKKDISELLGIE